MSGMLQIRLRWFGGNQRTFFHNATTDTATAADSVQVPTVQKSGVEQ